MNYTQRLDCGIHYLLITSQSISYISHLVASIKSKPKAPDLSHDPWLSRQVHVAFKP